MPCQAGKLCSRHVIYAMTIILTIKIIRSYKNNSNNRNIDNSSKKHDVFSQNTSNSEDIASENQQEEGQWSSWCSRVGGQAP